MWPLCIKYHTTHGTYKRDVQLVRACMHDPMSIQGKHTGCSWCAYSECCATLVQCRLPTCFSGRYRWKSLALVQRPVAFPASYWTLCFKGLWFPKIPGVSCNTFPQWQNGFHARLHVSAANALVQHFPSFRWLAGIRFPNSFSGPDRGWSRRRCTWTPQSEWQKNNQHEKTVCKTYLSTIVLIKMFLNWLPATTVSLSATQIVADEFLSPIWAKPRLFQYNVEVHCFNTMLKSIRPWTECHACSGIPLPRW